MYVDIITKAICGKGKKQSLTKKEIETPHPISNLLGCWVFNHRYSAQKIDNTVVVDGVYDIHLWYAYDNETNTDIAKTTVQYTDEISITVETAHLISDYLDILVKVLKQPNCIDTTFKSNSRQAQVKTERELLALIIGETKLKVEAKELPNSLDFPDTSETKLDPSD